MKLPAGFTTGAEPVWERLGFPLESVKRVVNAAGYILASVGGGIYSEHRMVATVTLGRGLKPGEVVHHKNHRPADNRPENLQVFASQPAHMQEHAGGGKSKEYLLMLRQELRHTFRHLTTRDVLNKVVELTADNVLKDN